MRIYNTLTRKKEEFSTLIDKQVSMYACGITVSGDAHIGHAYQALIYDIIRKYLEKTGYKVNYARNYTDVDDKIIAKSKEIGMPPMEFAELMIKKIDTLMRAFQVDDPTIWLKATCSIDDIIKFIEGLIEKGNAYSTERGDVYFDVKSFAGYGMLSGRKLDDALESVRIENEENKHSPMDFALWKSAKEGEIHWESPWGKGRPGWHIECSAMNMVAFGEQIDIHGGGRDLIFPHHENEIAQTEALTGKRFASYWIHNGLIKVNGQKMSKSLGNSLLVEDLLRDFSPETIKLALLQTHYRGDINVTDNLFLDAEKHLYSFYQTILEAENSGLSVTLLDEEIDNTFNKAMDDDFNTAKAISDLFGLFKQAKALIKNGDSKGVAIVNQIKKTFNLIGLFNADAKDFIEYFEKKKKTDIPKEVLDLVQQRADAKKEREFSLADEIRNKITALGYMVKDTKDGVVVEKI